MGMAANLQSRGVASFATRLVNHDSSFLIWSSFSSTPRRGLHDSVCNKKVEENAEPTAVSLDDIDSVYKKNVEETAIEESARATPVLPDDVIPPLSEEYWEPNPKTGVFGPATDDKLAVGGEPPNPSGESVLEEKAFFRPLEDLDIPPPELPGGSDATSSVNKKA